MHLLIPAAGVGKRMGSDRNKLLLPLRAALTVEGSPQGVGWVFSPTLNVDVTDLPGMPGWNLGLLAGPEDAWATLFPERDEQ